MKDSINSAGETMEKYIWERLSEDITRMLDQYL